MKAVAIGYFLLCIVPLLGQADRDTRQVRDNQALLDPSSPLNGPEGPQLTASQRKHLARWDWYVSSRLGPDGTPVNIAQKTMEGLAQRRRMERQYGEIARSINSSWSSVGPSSVTDGPNRTWTNAPGIGRVDRIALHPYDHNTILIGTPAGGLWKTTDGGNTWTDLTDFLPSLGVSGIVISHADPDVIYVLTGDGDSSFFLGTFAQLFQYARSSVGVLKSEDGGLTWQRTGSFRGTRNTAYYGFALVQDPANADILYAATSAGLYRTEDGGATWFRRHLGYFSDVDFQPFSSSRIYAASRDSVIFSTDAGNSWRRASFNTGGLCALGRVIMEPAPSDPDYVYLLSGPVASTGSYCGFYRSVDAGESFTRMSSTPNILGRSDTGNDNEDQSFYDLAIAVSPLNKNTVYTGGLTVWNTTNGGTSFGKLTGYTQSSAFPYVHPDIHDIKTVGDTLWVACDGGFYRSVNAGLTWTDLSPGIRATQFYHITGFDTDVNLLAGGCQDNGVLWNTGSTLSWEYIVQNDGFDVRFDPNSKDTLFCSMNNSVYRVSQAGADVRKIIPDSVDSWFKPIEVHNTDGGIILVGDTDLYRTVDSAGTWENKVISGSWAIAASPSNNNVFYAAGGPLGLQASTMGALYRSSDTGFSWSRISDASTFPAGWNKITDIAVEPISADYVWVTFGGYVDGLKVYKSSDGGTSWIDLSGSLPNVPINCIAVTGDVTGYDAFVGTDIGVFYRSSAMSDWMPWSNGLPNVPVTEIVINKNAGLLRAATFGRGAWTANLPDACSLFPLLLINDLSGNVHYQGQTISTSSVINGGAGTNVSLKATNRITLTPGFRMVDDSKFVAYLEPCGSGGVPSLTVKGQTTRAPSHINLYSGSFYTTRNAAKIHSVRRDGDALEINFQLPFSGTAQFALSNGSEIPGVLKEVENAPKGKQKLRIEQFRPPNDGLTYILLFHDGHYSHFQEVIPQITGTR